MKLTKDAVARLALPPGKSEAFHWDDAVPGLALRLRDTGKTWVFQYRIGRRQRRLTLGSGLALSLADARATAVKLHARVRLGEDPVSTKAKMISTQSETFGSVLNTYLERQRQRLRPRSLVEVRRHLIVNAKPLHRLPLPEIDRRAVARLLAGVDETSGAATAELVRKSLSALFAWAMREGLADANPVLNTNRFYQGGSRQRVLSDDELQTIWAATAGLDQYSSIVRLLLLSGARREEIGALQWAETDLDRAIISLPSERTKNGRPFDIPLSQPTLAIIKAQPRNDRAFVFGRGTHGFKGWTGGKLRLDKRIKIEPSWTLHDLRRTLSTVMHERLGVQPHIVEACLNHVSGHQGGVAGVYNRSTYAVEKRRALEVWANHLLSVVEGHESKITALRR